jgi:branched-chain amino acid transport system ATP-binding protein
MPLLEVRDLHVAYGQIKAVRGVSLTVERGEIVTLVGANGAGKSSLLNAICGLRKIEQGQVLYLDKNITMRSPHELPGLGLIQVPEGRRVFGRMSVLENLELGAYCRKQSGAEQEAALTHVFELFPRLAERRTQVAGTLSGGEQQMLAIGRALMSKPVVLLLDEPSMGLAPQVADQIYEAIHDIARRSVTILLVEQNAYLAMDLAARAYVLEAGTIVLEGAVSELVNDEKVKRAYLG